MSVALIESRASERFPVTSPASSPRAISATGFARLLQRLHPDADRAAQEYERLRRALVKFFDWRGASPPEECADDALDRLVQKLEQTVVQDVRKYLHGIARLVALERRRGPAFSSIEDLPHADVAATRPADDEHPLRDRFDHCLGEMTEENRSLILRYYEGERSAKITNRHRLATGLGVTENALRSRVQRLRDRLEHCVNTSSEHPRRDTR